MFRELIGMGHLPHHQKKKKRTQEKQRTWEVMAGSHACVCGTVSDHKSSGHHHAAAQGRKEAHCNEQSRTTEGCVLMSVLLHQGLGSHPDFTTCHLSWHHRQTSWRSQGSERDGIVRFTRPVCLGGRRLLGSLSYKAGVVWIVAMHTQ